MDSSPGPRADLATLEALRGFDTATIFNAVVETMGASQGGKELENGVGQPENYTGPEIRSLLPNIGRVVGYVFTSEWTPLEPTAESVPWESYYLALGETPGPIVAVMKDVDSRPGRGATFGDNMAAIHKMAGVVGVVVDGTVRDIEGIERIGMPVWGTGQVPGHGVYNLVRFNQPIMVGRLLIRPGELVVADRDGVTTIPANLDPVLILEKAREIRERERQFQDAVLAPGITMEQAWAYQRNILGTDQ